MLRASAARVEADGIDWVRAHEALSRLARERAAADAEEGRWLLAARRSAAHVHLGFGSFGEYVERLFGYTPRSTQEKLRVAGALEELPGLSQALETGSLGWSAVRELTRVAVADTEREWIEFAQGKTVRQIEELVANKHPGDGPSAASLPSARRHVLRFDVAPETFALFREAITCLRRQSGDALDDDSALLSMARHVLGGPQDDGRASYQIALTVCPACGTGAQQASGGLVAVGTDVVAMAHCDAQHLNRIASRPANENAVGASVEGAAATSTILTRDIHPLTDGHPHADVGDDAHAADGHGDDARADNRGHANDAHVGRETAHAADGHGDEADTKGHPNDAHMAARAPCQDASVGHRHDASVKPAASVSHRAKQTIPPALRRAVLLRDQHRCQVPGCKNTTFLDVHHIELRSEGGRNEPKNLISICSVHHRAAHRGQLLIEADTAVGVRFWHADGTEYGHAPRPQAIDVQAKLFAALRGLGFKEREVRVVLAELRQDDALRDQSLEHLLREALRRIQPARV